MNGEGFAIDGSVQVNRMMQAQTTIDAPLQQSRLGRT